jgi:hypothetical protein
MSTPNKSQSAPNRPLLQDLIGLSIFGGLFLFLILASGAWIMPVLWLLFQLEEREQGKPLTLELGGRVTTHSVPLADYTVDLDVFTTADGDNGPATINVMVNGTPKAMLASGFNYDLWSSEDPGRYQLLDVDGDRQADLIIRLSTWIQESYYVSSQDGEIYPYDVYYDYPRNW